MARVNRAGAGQLRHKIKITRETATQTAAGDYATTKTAIARPWAMVEMVSGRERDLGETAFSSFTTYRITIRYRADIKTSDQIDLGTETLNIQSAGDPDGNRAWLVIMAITSRQ